jgi:pimeloyl-ACP methyl ester carboxylesterase
VRIKKLVLISAVTQDWLLPTDKAYKIGKQLFSPKIESVTWLLFRQMQSLMPSMTTRTMFRELSKYAPVTFNHSEIKELQETTIKMRSGCGFINDLDQTISRNILSGVACPTLILHSEYDNSVPLNHPEKAKKNIKNSHMITYKNRWGHLLWLGEESKRPIEDLKGFLATGSTKMCDNRVR